MQTTLGVGIEMAFSDRTANDDQPVPSVEHDKHRS